MDEVSTEEGAGDGMGEGSGEADGDQLEADDSCSSEMVSVNELFKEPCPLKAEQLAFSK